MRKRSIVALIIVLLCVPFAASAGSDKDKDQMKAAIDDLKNEIVQLERQISTMQQSMDRNSGQMSTLITQMSDNVSAIRQAQGRVAAESVGVTQQVGTITEQLSTTGDRIGRLSGQLADLRNLVEKLPKMPAFDRITPGNPDQLFAAAVADYYRANYDLALNEFKQYVDSYPTSELVGNAQYWLGECYLAKDKPDQALIEYDKVPLTGDKAAPARFKKIVILKKQGRLEEARKEFAFMSKKWPKAVETSLAGKELEN